jgi:alpha-tubulin suppressor-like RCC1 family protein
MVESKEVYTVGQNAYGELAHGDNIERHVFTLVDSCKNFNVVQVAAGNEHSLILIDTGDVYSSGYNEMGNT